MIALDKKDSSSFLGVPTPAPRNGTTSQFSQIELKNTIITGTDELLEKYIDYFTGKGNFKQSIKSNFDLERNFTELLEISPIPLKFPRNEADTV